MHPSRPAPPAPATDVLDPEPDPAATLRPGPGAGTPAHRPAPGDRAGGGALGLAAHRPAARRRPAVDPGRRRRRRSGGRASRRRRGHEPRWRSVRRSLLRLHDLVLERQDEIIDLICWESGKARKHAFDEPLHIALTARYYARTAAEHLATRRRRGRRAGTDPGRGEPRPEGRRRHHLAVELPVHDGAVRRRCPRSWPATRSSPSPTPRPCSPRCSASSCSRRPASRGPLADGRRTRPGRRHRHHRPAPTTSASPAPPRPAR